MPGSGHCCRLQAEPFAVAQGIGARLARIAVGDHAEHTLPAAIRQSGGGNPIRSYHGRPYACSESITICDISEFQPVPTCPHCRQDQTGFQCTRLRLCPDNGLMPQEAYRSDR